MGEAKLQDFGPNFRIQRAFFDRVWEQQDEKALFELFDGEASGIDPARVVNPDTYRPWRRGLLNLMECIRIEFQDWLEQGDRLTMRGVLRGRSKRHGNQVVWPFAGFGRYRNGKIVEAANYLDHLSLFEQLGLVTEQAIENCLAGENLFQEIEEAARREEELKIRPGRWLTKCGVVRPSPRVFIFPGATLKRPATFLTSASDRPQGLLLPDDEQLEVLFEASTYGMAIVDENDRILETNVRLTEFVNRPLEQLFETPFHELLHPLDRALEARHFAELRSEKETSYRCEVRLLQALSVSFVRVTACRLNSEGAHQRFIKAVQPRGLDALEDLVRFQETERRLLSYDLHDGLAQDLAALWCHVQMQPSSIEEGEQLRVRALALVRRMADELRRKLVDLQSPVLEGVELSSALAALTDRVHEQDGLPVRLAMTDSVGKLVGVPALFLYRIVQEGLRNAARHADAKHVEVRLWIEGNLLHGEIVDDGRGFDSKQVNSNRFGLVGMRDRCSLLGGEMVIESGVGMGTRLSFSFPLQ